MLLSMPTGTNSLRERLSNQVAAIIPILTPYPYWVGLPKTFFSRLLGYPFELWTLERLQSAFEDREGIHLSDSTIWTWLAEEGLEWKRQQSWFQGSQRHDSQFVEKRGASSRLISPRRLALG